MKYLLFLLSLVLIFACKEISSPVNRFSSQSDTLIISTEKLKGIGLFRLGAGGASFRDTTEWKNLERFQFYPDYPVEYPENVEEIKLGIRIMMFDSLRYYKESGQVHVQQNFAKEDQILLMVKCTQNNEDFLIVDENHNSDFRDDSVRRFEKWDWNYDTLLIPCTYEIKTGNDSYVDTSWFKIGYKDDYLLQSTSQHLIADITIDNQNFTLGVADMNHSSFCFFKPIMYPFAENGIKRDTFLQKDIVGIGDYIRLGKYHYKFDRLYNGSGTVVLIKEANFNNLTGSQVGMNYPEFKCLTIQGDTLVSTEMIKDKPLLIVNISGCTSRSYSVFKELNNVLKQDLNIIALDYGVPMDLDGTLVDVEIDYNEDIYAKYRQAYSSYDCYLIDTTGRILDKFSIFNWESNLSEFFGKVNRDF